MRLLSIYQILVVSVIWHITTLVIACAQIQDPIQDYLLMEVPDRRAYNDACTTIYQITCDVDNDGKSEIFIGCQYAYSGNKSIYWTAYAQTASGYARLTPSDQDIPINFYTAFIGLISEKNIQGILQIDGSIQADTRAVIGAHISILYVINNQLTIYPLPDLDFSITSDAAFYDQYFNEQTGSRTIKRDSFTADDLRQKGYIVPTW